MVKSPSMKEYNESPVLGFNLREVSSETVCEADVNGDGIKDQIVMTKLQITKLVEKVKPGNGMGFSLNDLGTDDQIEKVMVPFQFGVDELHRGDTLYRYRVQFGAANNGVLPRMTGMMYETAPGYTELYATGNDSNTNPELAFTNNRGRFEVGDAVKYKGIDRGDTCQIRNFTDTRFSGYALTDAELIRHFSKNTEATLTCQGQNFEYSASLLTRQLKVPK